MSIDLKKLVIADRHVAGELYTDQKAYLGWTFVGALACLAAAYTIFGDHILVMTAVAWAGWIAVDALFSIVRRKPSGGGSLVFAILFALMCPPEIPLWMVGVGAAFGCVFGKNAFGGTGHHVFNPVLVGKAFLVFSYPSICVGPYFGHLLGAPQADAWILSGAVTLLAALLLAWRVRGTMWTYGGLLMGLAGTYTALDLNGAGLFDTPLELVLTNGTLFAGCLLAADPAGAPRDKHAKLLFGLIIGVTAAVMRCLSNYFESMMCAVLFGNLCAPTFDIMVRTKLGKRATS